MSNTTNESKDYSQIKRYSIYIVSACVAIIVGVGLFNWWHLRHEAEHLAAEAKAGPHVDVAMATRSSGVRTLNLVGEALPFASVTLYAKVSGYLKSVKVDKGDKVKKDQILAVIESPEIDKEYQGALADAKNKKSIAGRMNALRERNLVSPQEADQADSDAEVTGSRLGSLAVQKGYEVLRAPFEGTVTSRYVDEGALVQNATSSQTSAQPVVTVSQVDRLRVYVYVDQRDASFIQVGSPANVKLDERPDLHLEAKVTRVSGELDPKTKMLLTEIDIENQQAQLVPGSFVHVSLDVHTPQVLQLPVQALVIAGGKTMIPIVDHDDLVHYREIKPGDNDGKMVSVLEGVQEGERVALNVGSTLSDGSHVRPNAPKGAESKPPEGKDDSKVEAGKPGATVPAPAPSPSAANSVRR